MFDETSRYYEIETTTLNVAGPDGETREVRYVRRRFIADAKGMTTLVEHTVTQGDRLDNITDRYLGDPTLFWQVCDANDVMQPEELEETGRAIKIGMPGV
jgi:hypothetical protein